MSDSDNYHKRRFLEMAVCAMLTNSHNTNVSAPSRVLVNRASELWDEIEHQCPKKDDER